MMEESLMDLLTGDPGIAAVVGDRVHWGIRPQGGTLPDITMFNLGGPVDYTMQGASGLRQVRIQIDCWSKVSKAQALSVRRAVEAALSGQQSQQQMVEFQGIFIDSFNDDVEVVGEAGERYYRERLDFLMWVGAVST